MKLAYKIPHRVTCRMVGGSFVATCSCRDWSKGIDPRYYERLPVAFGLSYAEAIGEVISSGHEHVTGHVLEASLTARLWAGRRTKT